jgi:predicted DNA-binding transcriptional regulator AlpA
MSPNQRFQPSALSLLCDRIEILIHEVQTLHQTVDVLKEATAEVTKNLGTRLTRTEVRKRLDVSNYTLNKMMAEKRFPRPGRDAKWLLSEIIEWETTGERH